MAVVVNLPTVRIPTEVIEELLSMYSSRYPSTRRPLVTFIQSTMELPTYTATCTIMYVGDMEVSAIVTHYI